MTLCASRSYKWLKVGALSDVDTGCLFRACCAWEDSDLLQHIRPLCKDGDDGDKQLAVLGREVVRRIESESPRDVVTAAGATAILFAPGGVAVAKSAILASSAARQAAELQERAKLKKEVAEVQSRGCGGGSGGGGGGTA